WVAQMREDAAPPPDLRLVIVGSETVRAERLARWKSIIQRRVRLLNAYGPSETAITATLYDPDEDAAARARTTGETVGPQGAGGNEAASRDAVRVAIGRPLPGVRVYVLDTLGQPVPVGVPGEAHIGGAGVALGYLNRPELSAEKFIPDPFSVESG